MIRLVGWVVLTALAGAMTLAAPSAARAQSTSDTIQQIRIEGEQRIEPETVVSYLAVKVGGPFSADLIDKSLKTLFATGLFADVNISREGFDLLVRVVENPLINRVAFEGNSHLETSKLQDEAQLKARTVFTRTKVQNDVKRLLELYRRNGRFAATVEPKIIKLEQNRVDLVFEISEESLTGICRIAFIGNKRFEDAALRGELQTKESRWFRFLSSDDSYDPDRVLFDRELLRRFYLRNGYADFHVLSAVAELAPDHSCFYLTFTMEEGERYHFGKVDLRSTLKNLDPEALRKQIDATAGDWYDSEQIDSSVKKLTDALGNLGYAFVEIEPNIDRDKDKRVLDVSFAIKEGPKVYVERIDVTGNVRTLDQVIRREFRLAEGDAFNSAKLKRSEQRLKDLDFFKKVEVTNIPGSSPDRTVIQAKVEEQSTGSLSIGAGYSTTDGVLGQISVQERNLLGRGQDLRAAITLAQYRSEYDISFTEPYLFGRDVAGTFDIFRVSRDLTTNSTFSERSTGASFSVGYNLAEKWRQSVHYTLRNDNIYNVISNASLFIQDEIGARVSSIVGEDTSFSDLDSRLEPTEGYFLSFGTDAAGLGGDVHNLRGRVKAGFYYPFAPQVVLSTRGEAAKIYGIGERVRFNDRFYTGGDNFRGFKIGGVGARDLLTGDPLGSKNYYVGTVEVSFPVGLPAELGVSGRAFTDFGSSFGVDEIGTNVLDSSALRASAGVGVSWKSPFGPIRVDVARPYLRQPFDKSQLFKFSFGTKF